MSNRIGNLTSRIDPINWEISFAARILIVVIVAFAVLESLPIGTWQGRVVMWLALATIVTVICRVQRIRYREIATLVVPAVLLLAATSFAADRTLQLISTFVIFFGTIAIPFFPRTLVAWIGYIAPDYYRSIGEADEAASDAFAHARKVVDDELVANEGDPTRIRDTVAAEREAVMALDPLDAEWEQVRALLLRYLNWYVEVSEPTETDWAERRLRLDSAVAAYSALRKTRNYSAAHRLAVEAPAVAPSPRD